MYSFSNLLQNVTLADEYILLSCRSDYSASTFLRFHHSSLWLRTRPYHLFSSAFLVEHPDCRILGFSSVFASHRPVLLTFSDHWIPEENDKGILMNPTDLTPENLRVLLKAFVGWLPCYFALLAYQSAWGIQTCRILITWIKCDLQHTWGMGYFSR